MLALVAVSLAACASQEKKDAPIVDDLEIRGTHAFSESAIKKKILTTETGWWPFADEHYFDPVEWQSDLARIERFYHARGYYQARVQNAQVQTIPPKQQGQPARVNLLVEVVEGEPVRVGKLQVSGLEPLTEAERQRVTADLPLAEKEIFDEGDWDATKAQVLRGLKDLGHARAQMDGQAVVDVGTHQAQLTIRTAPGGRYRFGDVEVRSGARTGTALTIDPNWVAEQVRLAIGYDRQYSEGLLDEAQRRVFSHGRVLHRPGQRRRPADTRRADPGGGQCAREPDAHPTAGGGRGRRSGPPGGAADRANGRTATGWAACAG